jgi:glutathione synthase/RimK-type ligase-like ATP-grasp enzyme
LAQLYDTADRPVDGARHLGEAVARKVAFRSNAPYAARRVLVLKTAGGYLANALLDFCIDPRRTNLDTFYVTPTTGALPDLPADGVLFNAISETEAHAATIARAIALTDAQPHAVLNPPRSLRNVRRTELAGRLLPVAGAGALPAVRASRRDPIAPAFPLLMRPVDTHRGDGLERIDDASGVAAYVARNPAEHYILTPFVDYRSHDGYYRKYRVVVVGGVPYPYHLGISETWLVHYWRAARLMRAHGWMRAEEERFLREPEAVFPAWSRVFGEIAAALGLDYFGVDCALLEDGNVLVFECDPSAFVHCREDPNDVFAYKFTYVPRIFAALDELLDRRFA